MHDAPEYPRAGSRRVVGCLALFVLVAAVPACGGPDRHLADVAPCPTLRSAAERAIVRRVLIPGKHEARYTVPAVRHLNRPATVRRLAAALCALPGLDPRAEQELCRAGVDYTVSFYGRHRRLATATIPTVCQPLTGLGPRRAVPPRTWTALGDAFGVPHATVDTFIH